MASGDFDGFVVVVTGASSGLGRAIAEEAAARGAEAVVVNYAHNRAEAEETARRVEAAGRQGRAGPGRRGQRRGLPARSPRPPSRSAASTPCSTTPARPPSPNHADMDAVTADELRRASTR